MAIQVEHELHHRRRGRNTGVGLLLAGFIAIVFGLTVVKVLGLSDPRQMERFDHVARPMLEPDLIKRADQMLVREGIVEKIGAADAAAGDTE